MSGYKREIATATTNPDSLEDTEMEEVGRNKHHHHHHRASVASIAAAAGIMPATTASTPSDEDESASSVVSKVIGTVGRWQVEKACLLGLSSVPLAWHFMAYPLLSQEKEFWYGICNTQS